MRGLHLAHQNKKNRCDEPPEEEQVPDIKRLHRAACRLNYRKRTSVKRVINWLSKIQIVNGRERSSYYVSTLLGFQSWVRFCQQEFGEFPRPAWAVGSYSSGPPAGGTPQLLVDKTSPMTGRLRVYIGRPAGETYHYHSAVGTEKLKET